MTILLLYPIRGGPEDGTHLSLNPSSVTGDPRSSFYCDNGDGSKSGGDVGSERISMGR